MGGSPSTVLNSRAQSSSSSSTSAAGSGSAGTTTATTSTESPLLAAMSGRSPRNSNRRFSGASLSSLIRPGSPSLSGGSGSALLGGGPSSPRRSLSARFQLAVSEEKRKYKLGVVGFNHSGVEHFKYQCMRESGFQSEMTDSRPLIELIESQIQLFCDEVLPLLDDSKDEEVCHFRDELEHTFGRVSLYTKLSDDTISSKVTAAAASDRTDTVSADDDEKIVPPSIITLFTKCLKCASVKKALKSRAFNPRLSLAFINYIKASKLSERFDISSKSDFIPNIDDIRWFIAMENVVDVFEMQWRNHPLFFHEIKIHRCKPIRYDHLHFFDDFNGFVFLSSAMGYRKYVLSDGVNSAMLDSRTVPRSTTSSSDGDGSTDDSAGVSSSNGTNKETKSDRELALVADLNMFGKFLRKLQRFRVPSIVIVTDMNEFGESLQNFGMNNIAHLMPVSFPTSLNPTAVEDCQRYIHDNFKSKATLERYELYMHFHDLNQAVFAPLLEDITHSVVMRSLRRSGLI